MVRLVMLLWIIAGTVLAGVAVLAVLTIGSLSGQAMTLIGPLATAGFVVAVPIAFVVAKKINRPRVSP